MMIDKSRSRSIKFVISLVLFAYLTYFVSSGAVGIDLADAAVITLVQVSHSHFWVVFYKIISWVASPSRDVYWVLIAAFFGYGFKYKIQAIWSLGYMAGAMSLGLLVKHLVGRMRPIGHLAQDTGYSYPSGHVLGTFILVSAILIFVVPELPTYRMGQIVEWVSVIWLLLVIFARIYLNAHYPTDTLGAVLLGWCWTQVMAWVYVRWARSWLKYKLFYRSYL
ncbi:phosphatase PAP2 family protein [Lactiplantibacillus plajomi]